MRQPLFMDWQEDSPTCFSAARDGMRCYVYCGSGEGGRWWGTVEQNCSEDEAPFGDATLEA